MSGPRWEDLLAKAVEIAIVLSGGRGILQLLLIKDVPVFMQEGSPSKVMSLSDLDLRQNLLELKGADERIGRCVRCPRTAQR